MVKVKSEVKEKMSKTTKSESNSSGRKSDSNVKSRNSKSRSVFQSNEKNESKLKKCKMASI